MFESENHYRISLKKSYSKVTRDRMLGPPLHTPRKEAKPSEMNELGADENPLKI